MEATMLENDSLAGVEDWVSSTPFTRAPQAFIREYGKKITNFRDRWVYLLLLDASVGRQKKYASISLRQIAELTGCSLDSARVSVNRLISMGLVSVRSKGVQNHASEYELHKPTDSVLQKMDVVAETTTKEPKKRKSSPNNKESRVRSESYAQSTAQNVQLYIKNTYQEEDKEETTKDIGVSSNKLLSSHIGENNNQESLENPIPQSLIPSSEEKEERAVAGPNAGGALETEQRAYVFLKKLGMPSGVYYAMQKKGVYFDPDHCCRATEEDKRQIDIALGIFRNRKQFKNEYLKLKMYRRYDFYANKEIISEICNLLAIAASLRKRTESISRGLVAA